MDKRKKYFILLDTETCNGIMEKDKLNLNYSLVYDIGWVVTDKKGTIYERRSYIVKEIFFGENQLMTSSYYANKIPTYMKDLYEGKRLAASFYQIRAKMLEDMIKYNINTVVAHNASFDMRSLNNTLRWLTKSKYRWFFPFKTIVYDTMYMALDTFGKEKGYRKFCESNGYMTKHKNPRPRVTAEILYRYIMDNNDFEESHTGLEDVEIEVIIFATCINKHVKMRKRLWG